MKEVTVAYRKGISIIDLKRVSNGYLKEVSISDLRGFCGRLYFGFGKSVIDKRNGRTVFMDDLKVVFLPGFKGVF